MTSKTTPIVKCPECSILAPWGPSNKYRPFCSKRCKLLDLGAWAGESHRIKGETLSTHDVYELEEEYLSLDTPAGD